MGRYARINAQLEDAIQRKEELECFLEVAAGINVVDVALLELMDVEQSIGELKAALMEMAEEDGYGPDDYGEWLDTFEGE